MFRFFSSNLTIILLGILPLIVLFYVEFLWTTAKDADSNAYKSTQCDDGYFRLQNMSVCHPMLRCSDLQQSFTVTSKLLGEGASKTVWQGVWQEHNVAVSLLRNQDHLPDFLHGLSMLELFNSSPGYRQNKVVQLVGYCLEGTPMIVTEFHPLGAASDISTVLESFPDRNTLLTRFNLCVEFVEILKILHTQPDGPRVLCDANSPDKAMTQFLLTDNLGLVLNDMDALPVVNHTSGQLIKCGHRELQMETVAPEQRWGRVGEFDDDLMPPYDEKVDIWKVPDVCSFLIGRVDGASKLQLHLFNVHARCKQVEPGTRPTAEEILVKYKQVWDKLN